MPRCRIGGHTELRSCGRQTRNLNQSRSPHDCVVDGNTRPEIGFGCALLEVGPLRRDRDLERLALNGDVMTRRLEIEKVLEDPAASLWLKEALSSALDRDPVDAANDAEVLAQLLDRRCQEILSKG